ncbi:hypothetical protein [Exiguobacterium artemiae]|uniref:hypothetical protein n=1 Tax=Exiguobacterium artemiae TaxID=340145 RepID=UPI003D034820
MLDLFLDLYRKERNEYIEKNKIIFPLAHKEKTTQVMFKYLIYCSLPLISILAIAFNYFDNLESDYLTETTFSFWAFIILSFAHVVISIWLVLRLRRKRTIFGIDKKEKKKAIQFEMVRKFSENLTLSKQDYNDEYVVYVELNKSKDFDELKKGFEKRLSKEKKNVSFNYSILSIVISFFIAFSNSLGSTGNNGSTGKSFTLLFIIPIVTGLGIAIYNFYKDHYEKNYLPIEEELEDVIDLLQEVIIYKTISENGKSILTENRTQLML